MSKFYTIYLGDKPWENVIDDMNSDKDFAIGGIFWSDKKKAKECMDNLKGHGFETSTKKFSIVDFKIEGPKASNWLCKCGRYHGPTIKKCPNK